MVKHLLIEALGWILTAIGAYYIYEDSKLMLPYISLGIGIVLILFNFPKSFRKQS
ncbi:MULTISPECIES: hypothetical protein [Virgibacillus]|uniref:Uncharacterized protein n=1 Tax=Virgibacillus massiliensis TaxID=1462526 RepID=A0A024Q8Z2_9BACI|nr:MULTISPECIES: hypothetical protein [Virgibacillus]EQB37515.1 hypothetical protein M948_02920 [Virgibacillus sp. CM-4]MYL40265.1 hypothetical protein [Virgibacillus massiliensis]CDQ38968.1 hypothetical protein BN990_01248 [Virgibacillus massiliensis]